VLFFSKIWEVIDRKIATYMPRIAGYLSASNDYRIINSKYRRAPGPSYAHAPVRSIKPQVPIAAQF
jgi:hypothetical protein